MSGIVIGYARCSPDTRNLTAQRPPRIEMDVADAHRRFMLMVTVTVPGEQCMSSHAGEGWQSPRPPKPPRVQGFVQ